MWHRRSQTVPPAARLPGAGQSAASRPPNANASAAAAPPLHRRLGPVLLLLLLATLTTPTLALAQASLLPPVARRLPLQLDIGSGAVSAAQRIVARRGPGTPSPPPPIAPIADLPSDALSNGNFVDITTLGGPSIGIQKPLMQALQGDLTAYFSALTTTSLATDALYSAVADKWTTTLVNFQYSPGLQGFLDYFVPGAAALQTKLLQAVCTLYPWTPALSPPVMTLKTSYCAKAIPADILSKITQGLPVVPAPLPAAVPP